MTARALLRPRLCIFFQISGSVPSRSWSSSEIQQWMPSDTMRPSPTIPLHCCSIPPSHKLFSPSEVRLVWQLSHGSRLSTKPTRYITFTSWGLILLTHYHQVIERDPSSPRGYEMRHEALHAAGDFDNALRALDTMLSKITELRDTHREWLPTIQMIVQIIRQNMAASTSAEQTKKRRFAKLFNRLYVNRHVCSSTRPLDVSVIKPSRNLHSNPCQSSLNFYHR